MTESEKVLHTIVKDEVAAAIQKAIQHEREACAKIADEYSEWTHWGQYSNAAAAEAAAEEIAAAIRKGRHLTTEEIREVDAARCARLKAQQSQQ